MKAKLIGVMDIDFSNANGEQVKGTNIYLAFEDPLVSGMRTDKFFLKKDMAIPEQIKINDTLEIYFNHKGKIESINKA